MTISPQQNTRRIEVPDNMVSNTRLTWDEVCRRAGGRRRYNKMRQVRAFKRLMMVKSLCLGYGTGYGSQARIARELGVHRSTICRDFQLLAAVERRDLFPTGIDQAVDGAPSAAVRDAAEPLKPTRRARSGITVPDPAREPLSSPSGEFQVPRWLPPSEHRPGWNSPRAWSQHRGPGRHR
jgi:hypothetical protein